MGSGPPCRRRDLRENEHVDLIVLLCAVFLVGVFVVAAVGKLRDRAGTRQAVQDFGLPDALTAPAAAGLPLVELAVAGLLAIPATSVVGALGAIALLGAFIAAIAVNLRQGRQPDCHCFGQVHSAPASGKTIVRNVILLALTLPILANGGTSPSRAVDSIRQAPDATQALLAISLLNLAGLVWMATRLRQVQMLTDASPAPQTGTGDDPAPPPLEVGAPAPDFELEDLAGNQVGLKDLLRSGKPALLVFSSPGCGPCNDLFPDVAQWQATQSQTATVTVLSTGSREGNAAKAAEHEIRTLLIQRDGEPGASYRASGTPSGVVVNPDGTIGSDLAAGPDAIRELFHGLVAKHVSRLWERATGDHMDLVAGVSVAGDPIRDIDLDDLRGRSQQLSQQLERESLLIFWSPGCSYCAEMLDDVKRLEKDRSLRRKVIFVSDGSPDANKAQRLRSKVLLDHGFRLGRSLGVAGTPAAVWVRDGKVASLVAVGKDEIIELAKHGHRREAVGFSRNGNP